MPTCKSCGERFGLLELRDGKCRRCREDEEAKEAAERQDRDRKLIEAGLAKDAGPRALDEAGAGIILTTGLEVPQRPTAEIVTIVGAEAAVGMNVLKDVANSWRDAFGGRSGSVQKALKDARETCMRELRREAVLVGADAVVSIDFDYNEVSTSGTGGGILFVAATGTAVKLTP